jgi:peptidoglycan L-alanyl-D-glutamate endopeptidase CwlK
MGIMRDINLLRPEMAKRVMALLKYCEKEHVGVCVIETLRTAETQAAYYAQGRQPLETVNALRKKAGLYLISWQDNQRKITNAIHSVHQDAGAIDLCPEIPGKPGFPWWNAPQAKWEELGQAAEQFGLDWCAGGYGKVWARGWDNPHFEMPDSDQGGAA